MMRHAMIIGVFVLIGGCSNSPTDRVSRDLSNVIISQGNILAEVEVRSTDPGRTICIQTPDGRDWEFMLPGDARSGTRVSFRGGGVNGKGFLFLKVQLEGAPVRGSFDSMGFPSFPTDDDMPPLPQS